jgi:hypothetical protein
MKNLNFWIAIAIVLIINACSAPSLPPEHVNFLNEVASHGFLVIAIGPMPKEGEQTRDISRELLIIRHLRSKICKCFFYLHTICILFLR